MHRVVQVMAGAAHGGAEIYFVNLVLALHRAGLDQKVVIRRHAGRAALLRAGGVEPAELPFGGWFDLRTRPALGRLIGEYRPDIVVSWMGRASAAVPAGPYVQVGRLGGYYDLKYFRRCRHLVCNTRELVGWCVARGWPPERVHYLANFVTPRTMAPQARAALDTPAEAPLLLALGRLHPNKAFDVLLRALARLPAAYLWLAGEGAERAALERLAAELGVAARVRFLGWREDREALYAAADLCIVPSRNEPFGNVILDAWATGVPLVAAAAAGPAAHIRHEETGLLVPVDDSDALAAAISQLIADPALARRLADGGRAAWRAEFTEDAAVRRWLALFDRIAS
jgi:glycosyltransferase involved in cell wall biosynthesis